MPRSRIARIIVLGLAAVLCAVGSATAQDDGKEKKKELVHGKWYPTLEAGAILTQSAYSDNWAGGDKGSIVWVAILNASLENQFNEKFNWHNTLKLSYGQTHQQRVRDDGNREWDHPEKSTDLIDLETIGRFTLGYFLDPYVSARFESQFNDASDPFGRTLALNPIKLKESAGVAHKWFDTEEQSLLTRLGFTFRQNLRRLFSEDPPSDATTSESTEDGGAEFVADSKTKILDDQVSWTSKLTVYQPFFYSAQDDFDVLTADQLAAAGLDGDLADFTTAVDIDWENIFTTQITKIVSVQLYVRWVYDKYDNSVPVAFDDAGEIANPNDIRAAVRKGGQFKQTLGIGIVYRFL